MKYCVAITLFFITINSFSQEKKMSYYFDFYSIQNLKNHETGFNGKVISFFNSKDSTYTLSISSSNTLKEGFLSDRKKKHSIKFDSNFEFAKVEDLNKLSNARLYTVVQYIYPKKYKNYVEDFEYENDTLSNVTIVHLTQFKNKKKKKIINEHYYYFGKNENLTGTSKKTFNDHLAAKYNLHSIDDKNLIKIICIKDGAIASESEFIESKRVSFRFEFKIDDVYPKNYFTTTIQQ